jgi:hypothetical protein
MQKFNWGQNIYFLSIWILRKGGGLEQVVNKMNLKFSLKPEAAQRLGSVNSLREIVKAAILVI